jgi:hypothetical protein
MPDTTSHQWMAVSDHNDDLTIGSAHGVTQDMSRLMPVYQFDPTYCQFDMSEWEYENGFVMGHKIPGMLCKARM